MNLIDKVQAEINKASWNRSTALLQEVLKYLQQEQCYCDAHLTLSDCGCPQNNKEN